MINVIARQFPEFSNVVCGTTTVVGGASKSSYLGLNIATHVGDKISSVTYNRSLLLNHLEDRFNRLKRPVYLNQAHTNNLCKYGDPNANEAMMDAIWSDEFNTPLFIMTADCVPIMLTNGEVVCAIHAGWRGLANNIIEKCMAVFSNPINVSAWIGPYIKEKNYEVGLEVADHFHQIPSALRKTSNKNNFLLNLGAIARHRLIEQGVKQVRDIEICTYSDVRFYSHRRACHHGKNNTGRMVSFVIKLENNNNVGLK